MDRRSWIYLLVLAAIWGGSYLLIEIGLRDLSPAMIAWGRVAMGAVVLTAIAAPRGLLGGLRKSAGIITLVAAIQVAGPFLLIALGQQEISSSLAGILVCSAPLFTAILAIWVDQEERSTGARLAGVAAGLLGVIVLLGVDLGGSGAALLGGLAVLLAGLGYAVGGFIVKRRMTRVAPLGLAAAVMIVSTVLLAPAALLDLPSQAPGLGPISAVVALGAVGTGIAFAIFYSLISWVGPARAFVVTYIAPTFAVVYGVTLLDEGLTVATVTGLVLIVGGSVLAAQGGLSTTDERSVPAVGSAAP